MSKQQYKQMSFNDERLSLIALIDKIIDEYTAQNFRLTARQIYYQLVARDVIENTERSYKRITGLINDAKLAGYLDWDAIEDRTREFVRRTRWGSPVEIIEAAADGYHEDLWTTQKTRAFVIIEKEALVGVLEPTCRALDVPILAARGYPSGTVLREFVKSDVVPSLNGNQNATIFHLGDHDPSGIDMSRDLDDRIQLFTWEDAGSERNVTLNRIALNMPQIEEQQPPENPAKTTDSRFESYRSKYGESSWELDALRPDYLARLVSASVRSVMNVAAFNRRKKEVEAVRKRLRKVAEGLER